jgi:hemerythrin
MPEVIGFEWTPDLSVGVRKIDDQHQELFHAINDFFKALAAGQNEKVVEIVGFLEKYTEEHFAEEEKYMEKYEYPSADFIIHEDQHTEFWEHFNDIKADYVKNGFTPGLEKKLETHVCAWLKNHVMQIDMKLGEFLKDRMK